MEGDVDIDARLDTMIEIAEAMDLKLDDVVKVMGRCRYSTFLRLAGNPSSLPRYIQSSVSP